MMEIRGFLHTFDAILVHHMRRHANAAAHLLAHHALLNLPSIDCSSNSCPVWLCSIVARGLLS